MKRSKRNWRSSRFWTGHIVFIGILFLIAVALTQSSSIQGIERAGLRFAMQWIPETPLHSKVAVIAIDEASLEAYGPWPWPRDRLGRAIKMLDEQGVASVGLALPLDQSQTPPALEDILDEIHSGEEKLDERLDELANAPSSKKSSVNKARKKKRDSLLAGKDKLKTAKYWLGRLDSDKKLAYYMSQARQVILPAYYQRSLSFQPIPQSLRAFVIEQSPDQHAWYLGKWFSPFTLGPSQYNYLRIKPPYTPLLSDATAIGTLPASQRDGLSVGTPLLLQIHDQFYPSFPLLLAAYSEGLTVKDIRAIRGVGVRIGDRTLATGPDYVFYPYPMHLHEGKPPLPVYSMADLLRGKLDNNILKDYTVLIGHTTAVAGLQGTIHADVPPVINTAYNTAIILGGQSIDMPTTFYIVQRGLILLLAVYLILLPVRLHGRPGGLLLSAIISLLILNIGIAVLLAAHLWIPVILPALFMIVGHLLLSVRFHINVAIMESRQEAAEAHRELGNNYHSQGLFDQAFTEFKQCPQDHYILDPLYQLGQDFERKRLFTRALAVYEYMIGIDREYRDIRERIQKLDAGTSNNPLATMISTPANQETLLLDKTGIEKPMLGRYNIESQLGKGAMGTVYLGRDSKIGRKVAIKTLPFNQEFEGRDLEEVKWRFYREAEASGRLDHNNIITIYDVGEEHDLAYIAMDYAPGSSMDNFIHKEQLLPILEVIHIGQKIASALGYAHRKNVVHRDVKPANVIYDHDSGSLKITDFGIASLVDDNKTRTGTLLGTPSYMSPEQATGEKVDGRTDIYSLGVSLYQLLTGQLPFVGDSLGNLMYQITNTHQKDVITIRPDLTPCLSWVINKAMEKDPNERFQTGDEMAESLRRCELEINKKKSRKKTKA
jgi:eukaryotic-like serine/threonine-protein kinase